jgi:hypothetical protein
LVEVGLAVKVSVAVGESVNVLVIVSVGVAVGVAVAVGLSLNVGVMVGVSLGVPVSVEVAVGVAVEVAVGLSLGVGLSLKVSVWVKESVTVLVKVGVGELVGEPGKGVLVGVDEKVGEAVALSTEVGEGGFKAASYGLSRLGLSSHNGKPASANAGKTKIRKRKSQAFTTIF